MSEENTRIKVKAKKVERFGQMYPKYNVVYEDDDYAILNFTITEVIEGEPIINSYGNITVKGNMPYIKSCNDEYTIVADIEKDEERGTVSYRKIFAGIIKDLKTIEEQKIFFSAILTPTQVNNLFNHFESPLKIIKEHNIALLTQVKGIKEHTAEKIIEKYESNKDLSYAIVELDEYGLSKNMIIKIVEAYGCPEIAVKKVKENPYILANEVEGIGFWRADEIALSNGLQKDSVERIQSFVIYCLKELAEEGDSYIYKHELMNAIRDGYGYKNSKKGLGWDITDQQIGAAVKDLYDKNICSSLQDIQDKELGRIFLNEYYNLEKKVAIELLRILNGNNTFEYFNWKDRVCEIEEQQGWKHTEEQLKGIEMGLENQITVVTGGGGRGKTSTVTGMLASLDVNSGKYRFSQTSLAGKAASRMQEVTGKEGFTIHRLLGYNPNNGFLYTSDNPLPDDIIILDEISLIGGKIFLSLIKAIPTGAKLNILGDMGQLPSIGCMNLAKDLVNSKLIPTIELIKPHRQALKSGIITLSDQIDKQEKIIDSEGVYVFGELKDMVIRAFENDFSDDNKMPIRETAIERYKELFKQVDTVMDIQLLAPVTNRGDACVYRLNLDAQEFYNPPSETKKERIVSCQKNMEYTLREGDKVMIMKNNYKIYEPKEQLDNYDFWENLTEEKPSEKFEIYNGWTGEIKKIDDINKEAQIYFPIIKKLLGIPFRFLKNVELGYASTIHKFQGSSAKIIIGVLDYSTPPQMLVKELPYTLVTRAEKYCEFICDLNAFNTSLTKSGALHKKTFLREFLDGELPLTEIEENI